MTTKTDTLTNSRLFEQFLQEKRYVQNVSNNTVEFYRQSFKAFRFALDAGASLTTQQQLNTAIVRMREDGKSANCVNAYIRGTNPFLSWLYENRFLETKLKLKKLKCADKPMCTFSGVQIRAILTYKPKTKNEQRLLALLTLLIDCGARINEALTLTRSSVDLENLLLTITGKGNKTRIVPFSIAARKTLFKHLRSHSHELVFCTRNGGKLQYNNMRRDLNALCEKLDIKSFDGSFHAFRRYFATLAIRNNQNPFLVMRMLGHSSLTMTNKYLKLETADLSRAHISALQGGLR